MQNWRRVQLWALNSTVHIREITERLHGRDACNQRDSSFVPREFMPVYRLHVLVNFYTRGVNTALI